jgi:uncharacterized protein involved in outer membrane biogenesis
LGRWSTTLLLAIVVLVAAALILPSFIDWTQFRKPIEAEASRLVGRPVTISGDIGLHLLPRPGLRLGGLAVADLRRADAPILSAGRLEATAAWWPLITGRIEIVQLRLADAVIRVRINQDGTLNWLLPKGAPRPGTATSPLAPRGFASSPALISPRRLSFTDIIVERSRVLYADERNGADDRIEKLSGRFSLKSLTGPWSGSAGFEIQNAPLSLAFTVGIIAPGATTPAELKFGILDAGGALTIKGDASGLSQAIDKARMAPINFTGSLEVSARDSKPLGKGLGALGALGSEPNSRAPSLVWSRLRSLPVRASGTIALEPQELKVTSGITLGHTEADLAMVRGRHTPRLELVLASDLVDLDELIETGAAKGQRLAPIGAIAGPAESLGVCRCEGTVRVSAKALKSGGAALSDLGILVKLGLNGAELTDAHIVLPGSSRLSAQGRLPRPGPGVPAFDGAIAFDSREPKLFLAWLGVSTERVQPNALKAFTLAGPFRLENRTPAGAASGADPERYLTPHVDRAALTLDDQAFTISAAYDERDPGYFMFALKGEKLDADAYGLGVFWPKAPLQTRAWNSTIWGRAARAGDVEVALSLGQLKTSGKSVRGLEAELARAAGGPASAHLSIGDLAGYQILFQGARQKPAPDRPADENAQLVISGPGSPINLPFAGKPMAGSLKLQLTLDQTGDQSTWKLDGSVGTIKLIGEAKGAASEKLLPDIDRLNVSARFDRGLAIISGALRELTVLPGFDGNLTVDAQDFPSFMRELGYSYQPRRKDLGALSLVSKLTASPDHVGIEALSASVGEDSLVARAELDLIPERPVLQSDIKIAKLSLDGYLAAPDKGTNWSAERLKLDVFRRFDGEIRFAADRFEIGPWDMRKAESLFAIKDGTVQARNARAILYSGALSFSGEAHIDQDGPKGSFDMNVQNFDWLRAAPEFFPALGVAGKGNATTHIAGTARGASLMALVSSFGGRIELTGSGGAIKGFDLGAWGNGLNGARGPDALSNLAKTTLTQGTTTLSSFQVNATADKGTLMLTKGDLAFHGGDGQLTGKLLLAPRTLALRLALTPAAEPKLPPAVIVGSGAIATPSRTIDLKALSATVSGP